MEKKENLLSFCRIWKLSTSESLSTASKNPNKARRSIHETTTLNSFLDLNKDTENTTIFNLHISKEMSKALSGAHIGANGEEHTEQKQGEGGGVSNGRKHEWPMRERAQCLDIKDRSQHGWLGNYGRDLNVQDQK